MKTICKTVLLAVAAMLHGAAATAQTAEVLTTTGDRQQELSYSFPTVAASADLTDAIVLKPERRNQSIDGYGFALTYSSCYNLMHMSADARHALLEKTYSRAKGYGVSYARISIGCSDFSSTVYTLCDTPGLEHFALHSDETDYIIPILKEILAINPDLKIIAAPWTAPRWMKYDTTTWTGSYLNTAHYQDYADYFVKFVEAMKAHGINIYAVSPQNEPLNGGNCASMIMEWWDEADFVKVLAPTFKRNGLATKIYLWDHNYNYDNWNTQQQYPVHAYERIGNVEGSELVVGAAYHNYGGTSDELNVIHNQAPDKELIFSEASIGEWNDGRNLGTSLISHMKDVAIATSLKHCRAILMWNFMLDMNKGPNLDGGCQTCYGAIDIANDYKSYTLNSHYLMIAHLSAVVQPGAYRIDTEGWWTNGLDYVAFANPDGSLAVVFANSNNTAIAAKVSDGSHLLTVDIPARSAVSCRFNIPSPTFNGSAMSYEGQGNFSFTGELEQNATYVVGGRKNLTDDDFAYTDDYFTAITSSRSQLNGPAVDKKLTFRAVTGRYKVVADLGQGTLRTYPVNADGSPATLQGDGTGALWAVGGEGIGQPLYLWNGANWSNDPSHAISMAQVRPAVYQMTLVVGKQLDANNVNFKFFHQTNGWNNEYVGATSGTKTYRLTTASDVFGIGTGTEGHDNGNVYARRKLNTGEVFVFTIDCTNPQNAVLTVGDLSTLDIDIPALPANMADGTPFTHIRTYSNSFDYARPDGASLYIVTSFADGVATLSPIDYIPANMGIIIAANTDRVTTHALASANVVQDYRRNLLVPIIAPTYYVANDGKAKNYMLAYFPDYQDAKLRLGFAQVADGLTAANRAYLSVPVGVESRENILLVFDDHASPTGIAVNVADRKQPAAEYNLAGQRVGSQYKGVVIKNGVKVVAK